MNALIGSGFYAKDLDDFNSKLEFLQIWQRNIGMRDVVIVDNSEWPTPKLHSAHLNRVIQVRKNLGHISNFLGQQTPKLGGWSMSWILPAMVAYCEGRDYIYFEQDALAFGDWEDQILSECESKKIGMIFGDGSVFASCEQSIFLIKHWFILDAMTMYLNISESDGILLPENKFERMEREHPDKIGRHSLLGGRNRPLPLEESTWFAQKFTAEELEQLKIYGLI